MIGVRSADDRAPEISVSLVFGHPLDLRGFPALIVPGERSSRSIEAPERSGQRAPPLETRF